MLKTRSIGVVPGLLAWATVVHCAGAQCDLTEDALLTASTGSSGDQFGRWVALSVDAALIGIPEDGSAADGAGAAALCRFDGEVWFQEALLFASDASAGAAFGSCVAVAGDVGVVGAPGAAGGGSAYVFRFDGLAWQEEAVLENPGLPTGGGFGRSVVVADGWVGVGAPADATAPGVVVMFEFDAGSWIERETLSAPASAPGDRFGGALAMGGGVLVVGTPGESSMGAGAGGVHVYRGSSGVWAHEALLLAGDGAAQDAFGSGVGVRGSDVIAGAPGNDARGLDAGSAYMFREAGGVWSEIASLGANDARPGDALGGAVAIGDTYVAVGSLHHDTGADDAGAVYTFRELAQGWTQRLKLIPADGAAGDHFGMAVALDAGLAIIGAPDDDEGGFGAGSVYAFRHEGGENWNEEWKMASAAGDIGALFGACVSIDGALAVVGRPFDDALGRDAGAAYVFAHDGSRWGEIAKLLPSDGRAGDGFGYSVSLSGDSVIVGAAGHDGPDIHEDAGAAYVFRDTGASWVEEAKLLGSDTARRDAFGEAVALDGDVAVVGAYSNKDAGSFSGSAYVFRRVNGWWTEEAKLLPSDHAAGDFFGEAVAVEGGTLIVAAIRDDHVASDAGSIYVFEHQGGSWIEAAKLTAPDAEADDLFGREIDISGDVVVVGVHADDDEGPQSGAVYVYRRSAGVWAHEQKVQSSDLASNDFFGFDVDVDGGVMLVGSRYDDDDGINSGSSYFYRFDGAQWVEELKVTTFDASARDHFGGAVALQGGRAVVSSESDDDGGFGSGSVYFYDFSGAVWAFDQKCVASDSVGDDRFGTALALEGAFAIVGAPADSSIVTGGGMVYVLERSGDSWNERAILLPEEMRAGAWFGASVALRGGLAVVGAPGGPDAGAMSPAGVSLFGRDAGGEGSWGHQAELDSPEVRVGTRFGAAVATDGAGVLVGAPGGGGIASGRAYVYEPRIDMFGRDHSDWTLAGVLVGVQSVLGDGFGAALDLRGDVAVVGAPGEADADAPGSVYVFRREQGQWAQVARLSGSGGHAADGFGSAVSLMEDSLFVGAPGATSGIGGEGAVYVFDRLDQDWVQASQIGSPIASAGARFGAAIDTDGRIALAGAPGDSSVHSDAGSAFVLGRDVSGWSVVATMGSTVLDAQDSRGWAVGLHDGVAVVGAPGAPALGDPGRVLAYSDVSDCNLNGRVDSCDIATGVSDDTNGNGAPDECDDLLTCPGDADGNGFVNTEDLSFIIAHLGEAALGAIALADSDGDGLVSASDLSAAISMLGKCGSRDGVNERIEPGTAEALTG